MSKTDLENNLRIQFEDNGYDFDTLAVRAGQKRSAEAEHSNPIYLTSSYMFSSAAEAEARFTGAEPGNIYSRFTNPTVATFERRIAALEGAERAVATSSGMAAIMAVGISLLQHGDHVVCSRSVFGSTISLFNKYLSRAGISASFVDPTDLEAWQAAIQDNTRMLFMETPSNPLAELTDIKGLAKISKAHDLLLVVDNCFCTPVLQKPLEQGADIVLHSATKYLDGHGRCVGGVVLGSDELMAEIYGYIRTCGACLSPFNAWSFLSGLETLGLRMRHHSAQALAIAEWLEQQPQVEKVYYSGLVSHPQHELAKQQQTAFGGVFSFEVKGGKHAAFNFIDATQMLSITANLGDVKSTITHPASTTHGRLSEDERAAAGIKSNLIRLSVGLEDSADIKQDLTLGLTALN